MGSGYRVGVVRSLLAAAIAFAGLTAAKPTPVAAADPRPVPDPVQVVITPTGFSPAIVTLAVGQSVEFVNESGGIQTVTAKDNAFDSGPIPPGGGYGLALGKPGTWAFRSTNDPALEGSVTVGYLDLPGPAAATVQSQLPQILIPPVTDIDEHPRWGISASRSRVVVAFNTNATVDAANDALARANLTVIGATPGLNMVVAQVDPLPAPGDFAPASAALAVLRAHPAVFAAMHDREVAEDALPTASEASVQNPAGSPPAHAGWRWSDPRLAGPTSTPTGDDGNYGLEDARFPHAWNLLDQVRLRDARIDTVVHDGGFTSHTDLDIEFQELCQLVIAECNKSGDASHITHGTHVAGTVGATYDNVTGTPARSVGVQGGNPAAVLHGVAFNGDYTNWIGSGTVKPAFTVSGQWALWERIIAEKKAGGRFPNLRVVNYSATSIVFKSLQPKQFRWGTLFATSTCGPGFNDDTGASGACTPNTEDTFLEEVANEGRLARRLAEQASAKNVLIVTAAGNDSDALCGNATNVALTIVNPGVSVSCPAGMNFVVLDARRTRAFGWANANWTSGNRNIINVGAIGSDDKRAGFSQTFGEVSAAGVGVLSTIPGNNYGQLGGTSMASPHVAALAGYLAAYNPAASTSDIRNAIISTARDDTDENVGPRIDAYAAILRIGNAAKDIADFNDPSLDGNRRVARNRGGGEAPDVHFGPPAPGNRAVHSAPDGHVDMRDFRRFRDAWLQWCTLSPSTAGCPAAATIALDGAPDHPKKDLNFDGCVSGADAGCLPAENHWSRFDLNGDGKFLPNASAPVPLGDGGAPIALTDLDMLRRNFEETTPGAEGWNRGDLDRLMKSGDLEIHADAMFQAGASQVDLEVRVGAGRELMAARPIEKRGSAVMVTVPTVDAGTPIEIMGRAQVGDQTIESVLELTTLKHGQDDRIDLCVPTLRVTASEPALYADGADSTKLHAKYVKCDAEPVELEHVSFRLQREDGSDAAATLSADTATTDKSGRATVDLTTSNTAESVIVLAEITIEGSGEPQKITGKRTLDITNPPRLLYRLEQTTSSWTVTERRQDFDTGGLVDDITTVYTSTAPVVIDRAGAVTPIAGDAVTRSDARVTETVGPSAVSYSWVSTNAVGGGTRSGDGTLLVPISERKKTDVRVGAQILDFWKPDGSPNDFYTLADTHFEVSDQQIEVRKLSDLQALHYRYSQDENSQCTLIGQCGRLGFEEIALEEREDSSAFTWTADLSHSLFFTREGDEDWGTYQYCGPEQQYEFSPEDIIKPLFWKFGTANTKFRFVATITTDPDAKPEDLEFAENCEESKPPIAAIGRGWVTAKEGSVVKFLDASSDPNGDVVKWEWNFGDGATSDKPDPDHTYADDGTYHVTLKVTDATGNTDTHEIDVTITNVSPEISADPVAVASGVPAALAINLFDPGERDQEALVLEVKVDSISRPPRTVPGGASFLNLGILPDGDHVVTLKVTDKDKATATIQVTVTVGDNADGTVDAEEEIEAEPAPGCDYGVKLDLAEEDFVQLVSEYRLGNGRKIVYPSPTLTEAALEHARWLRDNGLFQHEGPEGNSPKDRATAAGYPAAAAVGENLTRGPHSAPSALVAWKVSDLHNINQLNPAWRAVGVARLTTPLGTLWVAVYGDTIDCPELPPDLEEPIGGPEDPLYPPIPGPPVVKAWTSQATPALPVSAYTVSDVTPETGQPIQITNRSGAPLSLQPGDGRPPLAVGVGATIDVIYLDPGTPEIAGEANGLRARVRTNVGGAGFPPQIEYTGPDMAAQGARVDLSAIVRTATGSPVGGRTVEFTIAGLTATAQTNGSGVANAELRLAGVGSGPQQVTVTVPPLPGGAGATIDEPFVVTANEPPVIDLNGPYELLVNDGFLPDFTGTFDPEGFDLAGFTYDLDRDGAFDDVPTAGFFTAEQVHALLCGGTCVPGPDYTFAARVYDRHGGEAEATAVVRFRRDFFLSVIPGQATINPGGSTSFLVGVSTTSGFAQPVALSVPDLPAGVSAHFIPTVVTPTGTATLTLSAAPNAASFDQSFTVRGTSGSVVRDATSVVEVEFGLVPACFGEIEVTVLDKETNLPIAGALVNGAGPTDAAGRILIENITLNSGNSPRLLFLQPNRTGYWSNADTLATAACGVQTKATVRMLAQQFGDIEGRVVVGIPDADDHSLTRAVTPTDTPIPDAAVAWNASIGSMFGTADSSGKFAFDNVVMSVGTNAPVSGSVSANSSNYWSDFTNLTVPPNTTQSATIALVPKCTGSADVRVLNASTRLPIAGATVSVGGLQSQPSGPDGRVRVDGIFLGQRNSRVVWSAFASKVINGRNIAGGTTVLLEECGSLGVADILLSVPVDNFGSARGRVTDSETGEPLTNIQVDLEGIASDRTDENGEYSFDNVFIGTDSITQRVVSTRVGEVCCGNVYYPQAGEQIVLKANETIVKDFQLTKKRYGSLRVRVTDSLTGDPLLGAQVNGLSLGFTAFTGPDGTVLSTVETLGPPNNAPRTVQVSAFLTGYWGASGSATVSSSGIAEVHLKLQRECATATIRGRVVNAVTREPLEGARVSRPPSSVFFTFTDAAGRFELSNITLTNNLPQSIPVFASKEGFLSATQTVQVYCGASVNLDFGTPNTGTSSLSGFVREAGTNAPLAGATVGGEWGATTVTAADGSYRFDSVPMGGETESKTWRVDANPPVGKFLDPQSKDVTVTINQEANADFLLSAPTNQRPVAVGQTKVVPLGQTNIPLTLEGSDPDGDPLKYRVMRPFGSEVLPGNTMNYHLPFDDFEDRFFFVVSDGKRDSEPAEVILTRTPNQPPTAVITGPTQLDEGSQGTLFGSASSDPDGFVQQYHWDLDEDGLYDDSESGFVEVSRADDAEVDFGLRVVDNLSGADIETHTVTWVNVKPIVDAGGPYNVTTDDALQVDVGFVDPGADEWTATVDYGDGNGPQPLELGTRIRAFAATALALGHSYDDPGQYTLKVEVCDDDGGCGTDEATVDVSQGSGSTTTTTGPTASTSTSTTTGPTSSTSVPTTTTTMPPTSTSSTTTTTSSSTTTTATSSTSTSTSMPGSSTTTTTDPETTTTTTEPDSPTTTIGSQEATTTSSAPVGSTTSPPTTTPPATSPSAVETAVQTATGALPFTGAAANLLFLFGMTLTLAGVAFVLVTRRSR